MTPDPDSTVPTPNSPPRIFDRALIRTRIAKCARSEIHPVLGRVTEDLCERVGLVLRDFHQAVAIAPSPAGSGDSGLASALAGVARVRHVVSLSTVPVHGPAQGNAAAVIDEEYLPLRAQSVDLIVSALTLQHVNDLPGALLQIQRALKPDGLFIASLLAGDSLTELRQAWVEAETRIEGGASPRVAPFADVRVLGDLLQRAGFALPVVDIDRVQLTYPEPFALMADLRASGLSNPLVERSRTPLRRATLFALAEAYTSAFAGKGGEGVCATVEIATLTGWAPSPNQRKALKPGSARIRLADALGTREIPLESDES